MNSRLRRIVWIVVVVLGFLQAWASRHMINPDGVSYIDVADKYLQRDWTWAVNGYWSPLYSWLIGAGFAILRPSSFWEYPVVHLVNFLIYLLCFAAFDFLLSQIIRYQAEKGEPCERSTTDECFLPAWGWQAIGYVLFLWCTLVLITLEVVTPDMLVATCVFFISGLLIRIRLQPANWILFVLFGIALGISYLAKAVMFPMAFIFLLVCLFSIGNVRKALPRVVVSGVLFLLVSSPFLIALHNAKGRWTFGDSGPLAYAWLINGTEAYIHWRGLPPGTGVPAHPTNKIFDKPSVYEFKQPIVASYPPWYDPSYWNEGLVGRFDPRGQVAVLAQGLLAYYAVFVNSPIGMAFLVSFLVLQLYTRRNVWAWIMRIRFWQLLVPSFVALAMYAAIHVETRYIGAYVILVLLALFSSVRFGTDEASSRLKWAAIIAVVVVSGIVIAAKQTLPAVRALPALVKGDNGATARSWQVADGLSQMGVRPGDQVAVIGSGFGMPSYWARLARVQIIGEITAGSDMAMRDDVEEFWHSNNDVKRQVIEAFAKTGAKCIVADKIPPGVDYPGWKKVGTTDHYAYFLR